MKSSHITATLLLLLGGFLSAEVEAQTSDRKDYNIDHIVRSDAWLSSSNAAGLATLPVKRVAIAEINLNKSDGGFRNYYESDDSYSFGAMTESYLQMSKRVGVYGSVSYDNYTGRNMCGSLFVDPYYNPFDIVEYADTTQGIKQKETYRLIGGIGVKLTDRLSLGGKIDYKAVNYAKMKDMRHENYMVDMTVSAGASYSIGNFLTIGANYIYRRSVEGNRCFLFGNEDIKYYSLVSYGAFYGSREVFGDTGFTEKGENHPLYNSFNGGALQIELRLSPRFSWLNEFTYLLREGLYGRRGSYTIVFTEHSGKIAAYNGTFTLKGDNSLHRLKIGGEYEKLNNFENIYRKETSTGNVQSINYYGQNNVLDRTDLKADAEYSLSLNTRDFNPEWVIKLGADMWQRKQTVSIYPYYRKQSYTVIDSRLSVDKNFMLRSGMISVRLDGGYGFGSGTPYTDGTYVPPSSSQKAPNSSEHYLNNEFEYLTASRVHCGGGVRYSLFFKGVTGYVDLGGSFTKALDIQYLDGDTFASIGLKVGCSF